MKKKHITIQPVIEVKFITQKIPEWTVDCDCPECGDDLYADWIWAGEFDEDIKSEIDDFPSWFLTCETCGENYWDDNGKLRRCEWDSFQEA